MWKSKLLIFTVETVRHVAYYMLLPLTPLLYFGVERIFGPHGISFNDPNNIRTDLNFQVKNWRTYALVIAYGELGVGEAYMKGYFKADMRAICSRLRETGFLTSMLRNARWTPYYWAMRLLWDIAERNTPESRLTACEEQYNVDDEYHRMIGGENYDHSLPYYTKPDQTWTEAHLKKYEAFAKRMDLKPGMEVLEIGCGFGSMSKYFADNHGVSVTAVTNSTGMGKTTGRRCKGSNVSVRVSDWRDITGKFDAIAVCEMAPHVGRRHLPAFFNKLHSLLKPRGRLVMQDYVTRENCPWRSSDFMNKHLYGGTYFYTIADAVISASEHLVLKEYEDMTPQYIRGLEVWVNTFENTFEKMVDYLGLEGARTMLLSWIWAEAIAKAKLWGMGHYVFVREDDLFENKFFHEEAVYSLVQYEKGKKNL